MPIYWNVAEIAELMDAAGIANRKQLRERAKISLPTAYAIFDRQRMRRIDVPTLEALAGVLHPASVWDLLEYRRG